MADRRAPEPRKIHGPVSPNTSVATLGIQKTWNRAVTPTAYTLDPFMKSYVQARSENPYQYKQINRQATIMKDLRSGTKHTYEVGKLKKTILNPELYKDIGCNSTSNFVKNPDRTYVRFNRCLTMEDNSKPEVNVECTLEDHVFLHDAPNDTYLRVALKGVAPEGPAPKTNVAITCVVDASHQTGRNWNQTMECLAVVVEMLQPGDTLSLIKYSTKVSVLCPPLEKGKDDDFMQKMLDDLKKVKTVGKQPDILAAVQVAYMETKNTFQPERSNQILLFTPYKPTKLNEEYWIMQKDVIDTLGLMAELGVKMTFFCIGPLSDENLFFEMVHRGRGFIFYVDETRLMRRYWMERMAAHHGLGGRNVTITLVPGDDVKVTEIVAYHYEVVNNELVIKVGDIAVKEKAEVMVKINMEKARGRYTIAEVVCQYVDLDGCHQKEEASVEASFKSQAELTDTETSKDVQVSVHRVNTVQTLRQAVVKLAHGDPYGARELIAQQQFRLAQEQDMRLKLTLHNELNEWLKRIDSLTSSLLRLLKPEDEDDFDLVAIISHEKTLALVKKLKVFVFYFERTVLEST